jgi:dolichyl-phosphate beta-glucosyltransferase
VAALSIVPSSRSLVIPMCDEAPRIGPTVEVLAASPLCDDDLEILLVDDGSTDGTAAAADAAVTAAGLQAKVVRQDVHRGKGAAVREGLLLASGATRVFVDADLPVTPADIERCFAALESGRADVVYGTRTHPASQVVRRQPALRRASGRLYNGWLRAIGLTAEHDTQCGLKGVTAAATPTVVAPLVTEGFAFDVELLARAARAGLRIEPVPVEWAHVEASHLLPLRDGLAAASAALRIRTLLRQETRTAP